MDFEKTLDGALSVSAAHASIPSILWGSLLKKVTLWTAGGTLFLSLIISLAELFSMLWRFLANDAPLLGILAWVGLGAPKHIVESLPVAFLFATVFILSDWHANRELEAVFSAGVSIQRLLLPLVALSVLLCVFEFEINERVSIPALRARASLQASALKESDSGNAIPGLIVEKGKYVYTFRYFDKKNLRLYDVSVIERNAERDLVRRVSAQSARWDEGEWRWTGATIYSKEGELWHLSEIADYTDPNLSEPPASFERPSEDVRMLSTGELTSQLKFLRSSGLPTAAADVERQRRYSFSLTPLIVIGLAGAFVGRFKKSIFLLSMLFSLSSATLYYVAQMLASLAAQSGMLSPGAAIWSVMCCFALFSLVSYLSART